jgi:SecD/SecF fusion protein
MDWRKWLLPHGGTTIRIAELLIHAGLLRFEICQGWGIIRGLIPESSAWEMSGYFCFAKEPWMNRTLKWKIALLMFLTIFAGVALVPSFYQQAPAWWKKYLAPEGLRLGLDLQGGMHLVLKVDLERAVENSLELEAQDLKETLAEQQISIVQTPTTSPRTVMFTVPNTRAVSTITEIINNDFPDLEVIPQLQEGTFPRIILRLAEKRIQFINQNAVDQSVEIIRNRIDQFGVAEPVIIRQGADEIVVQLPGVRDPERAMDLIGQTAQLEFKLIADASGMDLYGFIRQAVDNGQWEWGGDRRTLNRALQGLLPEGTEIYFEKSIDPQTSATQQVPLLIRSPVLMTGDMVKNAVVRIGDFNEPYVSLDLTDRGGRVFGQITEKSVGQRLAIILDENVRSAPVIRERILGGRAQISGNFTHTEASDLAIVLRVGALPAPVDIIQNLTVGASLGQDSINRGLSAGLFGALLVLVFMVIYYRLSGVVANGALFLNILFLFSCLALLEATLTLPGIAGIILAIGMAVDSNVLIFERMREEFALGKSVRSGVDGGYDKAFWTIVDSQVTTLITALALFLFGTGPIKGFAVTLSLGVLINLFTTLFGTRLVYDALLSRRRLKSLYFMEIIRKPNLDFMGIKKFTVGISGLLVAFGLIAFVEILRGDANLGVDFSGGTLAQYRTPVSFTLGEVRQAFADTDLAGVDLQSVEGENRLMVKLKDSGVAVSDLTERTTQILREKLPEKQFELESESSIGASVSATMRNKALLAIAISLAGVIAYLGMRFDLHFGLAAAAATFHDVLVVLGILWLLNVEINLLIVTALLTLAGYSLNDSVVVFDRIRENLGKSKPGSSFNDLVNRSVNEVIGRTIATSATTLMAVGSLFILGGSVIHDFSLALLVGVIVGTYSSVFVASPLLSLLRKDEVPG